MSVPMKFSAVPAMAVVAAVVAAGCGSSSNQSTAASSTQSSANTQASSSRYGGAYGAASMSSPTASSSAKKVTMTTAHTKALGTFIVDGRRHAVYMFGKDKQGSGKSMCSGACAAVWRPVTTTGTPKVSGGVKASKLTMLKRANGAKQLAYNGWPLYFFTPDSAGTTRGQGLNEFGGSWYVVAPTGHKVDNS